MNGIIRVLLAVDSIMLLLIVYCSKSKLWIPGYGQWSLLLLSVLMLLLASFCLVELRRLSNDSIEGGITEIELANDSYLPGYLGFFFVALSIPDRDCFTLLVVAGVLLVFLVFSQNLFYNPLFLLFGYQFYHIKSEDSKILVISRRKLKTVNGVTFQNLRRINDYTFLDVEEKQ